MSNADVEIVMESRRSVRRERPKEAVRVILWTCPRSVSTAFERCMGNFPNVKVFMEMYGAAFFMGKDRKNKLFPPMTRKYSYEYCKKRLEGEHPGYDFIFAKDFSLEMCRHLDMLPKGYRHVFLIRHPAKVFPSVRKMLRSSKFVRYASFGAKIKTCIPTDKWFFEDMWELYNYILKHPESFPKPIIIDADDLLDDPERMVKKYCDIVGLRFDPRVLTWEKTTIRRIKWEGPTFFRFANSMMGCYKNALNSTGFMQGGVKKEGKKSELGDERKTTSDSNKKVDDGRIYQEMRNDTEHESEEENEIFESADADEALEKGSAGKSKLPLEFDQLDLTGHFSDVKEAIRCDLPFYKNLYECRIRLDA